MAIQEIEKREVAGTVGITRNINQAAVGMIMDIVQAQQYTKPIPSTVRELTANAVDSQSEKERAFDILSGKAKVEDFFIEREGELYKDSKWDPSYYDLTKLNKDKNQVELIFREGLGVGRSASFIIRDYGVGVGKGRLEGILSIGYSSKRSRKDAMGSFGIGAKVALSTGADFYRMTTVYNGVKYKVQIFNRKLNSLVGAVNLETGDDNVPYTFSDGSIMYGEKTDELNYCEIEVPVLNHHKDEYILAVKTQLLYFPNVVFHIQDVLGNLSEVNFKANILYNSKNLVISSNSPYSKPHVVIVKGVDGIDETGVSYGYIDFKELELEDLNGDVGVKCVIRQVTVDEHGEEVVINEGISVVPSRESVLWNQHTRDYIKKQFQVAQIEATSIVEEELKETDFIRWINACKNIRYFANNRDSVIGRLSKIVDLDELKPVFKGETTETIPFDISARMFEGFKVFMKEKVTDHKTKKVSISKEVAVGWSMIDTSMMYLKREKSNRVKDLFLIGNNYRICTLSPIDDAVIIAGSKDKLDASRIINYKNEIVRLLESSTEYKNYDEIEVPDTFMKHIEKLDSDETTKEEREKALTPDERRALENRIVANTYKPRYVSYSTVDAQSYCKDKVEPKIKEIIEYTGSLYYGFQADESKLQFACHLMDRILSRTRNQSYKTFYGDEYKFLSVSQSNKKNFKMHSHIDDFFGKHIPQLDENGKEIGKHIIMDNAIVKWNTARQLSKHLSDLVFFNNFSTFNMEMFDIHKEILKYCDDNYTSLSSYEKRYGMQEHYSDFIAFIEKVEAIQTLTEDNTITPDDIAYKVKELTLPEGTTGGLVIDNAMISKLNTLLTYAGPLKDLFNNIPLLTNKTYSISLETSIAINDFIKLKHGNNV
jgi:hypothetical protein